MSADKSIIKKFNENHPPPKAPTDRSFDILHGRKILDPYRPLERMESINTHEYVRAQNARFDALIQDDIAGRNYGEALRALMGRRFDGMLRKHGPYYFNYFNDGTFQQSVLCVRKGVNGTPRILLDPNQIDPSGKTDITDYYPSPDGKYLAFTLMENGSDINRLHVLNIETGRWHSNKIDDHRILKVVWNKNSRGYMYTYQNHDRKVIKTRHHKIGNATKFDKVVKNPSWAKIKRVRRPGLSYTHMSISINKTPNGSVIVKDKKTQKWKCLIKQHKKRKILSVHEVRGGLLVHWREKNASKMTIHDYDGRHLRTVPLPKNCDATLGARFNGGQDMLISLSKYNTYRNVVYRYNFDKNNLRLFKNNTTQYKRLKNVVVERRFAKSKDGTRVPMTIIRRKDVKMNGTAATKLYGYGGFNHALTPGLGPDAAQWVQEGGVYVVANLRGGGEFGEKWYHAGRLENKQNVFDDFAACAEYLIRRKYTSSERLCCKGGSNGGLLTLATMLQRPELFGAVVSSVPVTDMFRYDRFGAGLGWRQDYGDIKKLKSCFNAAAAYSPLHNIKSDVTYPPTLVMTSDQDNRVVPLHSYKFVAAMNDISPQSPVFLRVARNQGHGAGRSRDQRIADMAAEHAFLVKTLGPIDQNAYKADLKAHKSAKAKNHKKVIRP